ncbi:MAG TPA: PAAR domain-containing protein [Gemmatimonadaceae bacterium]|jgi:uncharacterized Zn-binding protein involved in type VI secretion|nr:PAAR domain-containing protein [Gemmatimonadaceae bacterium]
MGLPAARALDTTSHGTPLTPGPGSLSVLIAGQPAWRALADTHVCPLVDGLKPHVGGKVVAGSMTVTIGGFPAARVGDMVVEAGAPNAITKGATSVTIG